MEQTNSGISTEAEILSAAAKDPKLSDNAFKEILLRASKMDEINATEVLSHCARNSSLNKLEHLKAFFGNNRTYNFVIFSEVTVYLSNIS